MKKKDLIHKLKLDQEKIKISKRTGAVEFRFPKSREYIMSKPIIDDDSEIYLLGFVKKDQPPYNILVVTEQIFDEFPDKCFAAQISLTINRQGGLFFWPVKVNGPNHTFFQEFFQTSQYGWCAYVNERNNKTLKTIEDEREPKWPDEDFQEILCRTLKINVIDAKDPVLQRWRGLD